MIDPPIYIASEIYRHSRYGQRHPLSIPRVSTVTDLARSLGWLPDEQYRTGPVATPESLARFHDLEYIEALKRAEEKGLTEAEMLRWNIGKGGNPIYPEVFLRPATAAGSSILAAQMLRDGGIIHNPAGGTHHGQPARASGFCYLNDPVLGILTLLDQKIEPIVYLDLDVHHGDGVEAAFRDDPRVLTISIHEAGRWPNQSGQGDNTGPGVMNFPIPAGMNDDEFLFVLETAILPTVSDVDPAALVLQCGVDALKDDPLSKQELSNRAYWMAVDEIRLLSSRLLVLGGGGYNPYAVGRAWTGVWARLNGYEIPDVLPKEAQEILRAIPWAHSLAKNAPPRWFETLADAPHYGQVRTEVRDIVRNALRAYTAE